LQDYLAPGGSIHASFAVDMSLCIRHPTKQSTSVASRQLTFLSNDDGVLHVPLLEVLSQATTLVILECLN
jgi:hypothetical protein